MIDPVYHFGEFECAMETRIPAGFVLVQHRHNYSHLAILASGEADFVAEDGSTQRLKGPCCINVPAGGHHGVRAVTDVVWFCVHGDPNGEGRKPDDVVISPDSSPAIMERMGVGLLS